jgi:hypothetical protein
VRKRIVIVTVIGIIVIMAIFVGSLSSQDGSTDSSDVPEKSITTTLTEIILSSRLDTEEKVLEFTKNYQGKDSAGDTLVTAFEKSVIETHSGEDIFKSPVTTVSFFASKDHSKEISDRYWKVGLELHTYMDDLYYEWVVDTETNSVYAGNEKGRSILDSLR